MSSLGLNLHGTPPGSDKPPDLGLMARGALGGMETAFLLILVSLLTVAHLMFSTYTSLGRGQPQWGLPPAMGDTLQGCAFFLRATRAEDGSSRPRVF